jgi:hypothetical protein
MKNKKNIRILWFIIFLAAFSYKSYSFEEASQENTLYQKKTREAIKSPSIDYLFTEHHLPCTLKEYYTARNAWIEASHLLEVGKGEEAIPSLIYAERFYINDSLRSLAEIAQGKYRGILAETRSKIEKKCAELWTSGQEFHNLYISYGQMTRTNISDLCKLRTQSRLGQFLSNLKDTVFPIKRKSSKGMTGISYKDMVIPTEEREEDLLSSLEETPIIHLEEKKLL